MDKREILFRGKSITTGEWIESMTISKGTIKRKKDCVFISISEDRWFGVIPESVGQLSPKTDKSGIRVFEGDLLLVDSRRVCRAIMNDNCGCWDTIFVSDSNPNMSFKGLEFSQWSTRCDVIGNSTDNPELLK